MTAENRTRAIQAAGVVGTLAYGVFVVWLYVAQPRTIDELKTAAAVQANVYAVDAETGALRWTRRVHDHPFARVTGTPTLDGDRLYVPISSLEETAANQPGYECCTFRGSVAALGTATGDVLWQTWFVPPAAMVGKSAAGADARRS